MNWMMIYYKVHELWIVTVFGDLDPMWHDKGEVMP